MRTYRMTRVNTPSKDKGGPLISIRKGLFQITLGPRKKEFKGVPEVLALVAAHTGQFEIELEEPKAQDVTPAAPEEGKTSV